MGQDDELSHERQRDARAARSSLYGATAITTVLLIFLPLFEGPGAGGTVWESARRGFGPFALLAASIFVLMTAAAAVGRLSPGLLIMIAVISCLFVVILALKPGADDAATLAPVSVTAVVLYLLTAAASVFHALRG